MRIRRYRQLPPLAGLFMVAWALGPLVGCAPAEDDALPVIAAPSATPTSSGAVGGAVGTGGTASPTPAPTPALTLSLQQATDSLFVPPVDGLTPLYPAEYLFTAQSSSPSLPITWQSSDARVATVDQTGRVRALRPGTTVITASCQNARATRGLTVAEKARLTVNPQGVPGQAQAVEVSVRDGEGRLLASQATADLTQLGNLVVEVIARDSLGRALAAGRAESMSLFPNQLTTVAIPLNAPRLDAVSSGGPKALVTLSGSGFLQWTKQQGGQPITYPPSVEADFDGVAATVTILSDGAARVAVPASLVGVAARPFTLTVGGCPVTATFKLVGSIQVDAFPATMANQTNRRYTATAYDTDGNVLSGAELSWEANDKGAGTMTSDGNFMATKLGVSTITVRSGAVIATTSVTVE